MGYNWFPPSGDVLAVLIGLLGLCAAVGTARYFASASLSVQYEGLTAELMPHGDLGDLELTNYKQGLLDPLGPHEFAFTLTLVNSGWLPIRIQKPITIVFDRPQPLQAFQHQLRDLEPKLELLGAFDRGELSLMFDVLKRGEAVRLLVGTDSPVQHTELTLRLDGADDLPREIKPEILPGHLPVFGARVIGSLDLVLAAMWLGVAYFGLWVIIEVIPAWSDLSWLTPLRVMADVLALITFVFLGFGLMIYETLQGVYAMISGRYRPGALGSMAADLGTIQSRIESVPGRRLGPS